LISILDYGVGNIDSLQNAFSSIGVDTTVIGKPIQLTSTDKLILPGVGAFGHAMNQLKDRNLIDFIRDSYVAGNKILGVCLGMQLFFESSLELGLFEGISILPGTVQSFSSVDKYLKTPRISWSRIEKLIEHPLTQNFKDNEYFYFLHSFFCPFDSRFTVATSNYGETYSAIVAKDNVIGVQFHPEKSGNSGLKFLSNFAKW